MKLASIEKIKAIRPHPNADKLEFADVLGYSCLVQKGFYSVGDFVILIQPDTVLPEKEWSEMYRKFSKNRVRAMRFRGEWSFGIVENIKLLPEGIECFEGLEVSSYLGIQKYEPPQPQDLAAKGNLPYQIPKTDEERYQNLELASYFGRTVDVTQKIDGQSFTVYWNKGEFGVCGRSFEYKLDHKNNYTDHVERYNLREKLQTYCEVNNVNIALRGESYGQGIQGSSNNPHGRMPKGLAFFSVWLIDERRYAYKGDKHYFLKVCSELELPTVPILEQDIELKSETIRRYDETLTEINGQPFEGVVIVGDNFSFKVINKDYDSSR